MEKEKLEQLVHNGLNNVQIGKILGCNRNTVREPPGNLVRVSSIVCLSICQHQQLGRSKLLFAAIVHFPPPWCQMDTSYPRWKHGLSKR